MLCVVTYLYASSVMQWAMDVWYLFGNIQHMSMAPDLPIPNRADFGRADEFAKLGGLHQALFMFNMLTGDAVVIWRAWAVYQKRFWAISIPCILLLTAFALALVDIFRTSYRGSESDAVEMMCERTRLIAWPFSIGTNVISTILIGCKAAKAWQHRKVARELHVHKQSRTMSVSKLLSILIECGFIYSLLWTIVYFGEALFQQSYLSEVLRQIANQLAGLYPTLIIVIVIFHRTIWDELPTLCEGAVSASIPWAPSTSGLTDTFRTGHGVDLHLDPMVEIPVQNSIGDQYSIPFKLYTHDR
ncbi:hypothetical protein C8R45DRAFT_155948 [Mycena sanguinolenta]|nr:hypothetical protein C8R45DRAFT_155948 [Mycena sanguinolenta]